MSSAASIEAGSEPGSWLTELGFEVLAVEALAGDVSPRHYFRVTLATGTFIVAGYPASLQCAHRAFERSTLLLSDAGVRVPAVVESDLQRGWMLLEDLGPRSLWDERHRTWDALQPLLEEAARIATRIGRLDVSSVRELNPPLDGELLGQELQQTLHLFFASPVFSPSRADLEQVKSLFEVLCLRLDQAATCPCHRDFMARNLALVEEGAGRIAVLDHQDLRLGPQGYDLASLLNDSLYPPRRVADHLHRGIDPEDYHRAAAQRGLKIIGTFLRFAERGSRRYLPLIGPSYQRALEHLGRLPESRGLTDWMADIWEISSVEKL